MEFVDIDPAEMIEIMNIFSTEVCGEMNSIAIARDLYGNQWIPSQERILDLLLSYSHGRCYGQWDVEVKESMRPLFNNYGYLVFAEKPNFDSVKKTLTLKSSLVFISQDFPEIAEDILYSPFMEELDKQIDSWPINNPPFLNFLELADARSIKERFDVIGPHLWWNVLDQIESISGVPCKLFEAEQRQNKRTKEEIGRIDEHIYKTNSSLYGSTALHKDETRANEIKRNIESLRDLGRKSIKARGDVIISLKNVNAARQAIEKAKLELKNFEYALSKAREEVDRKEAEFDQFADIVETDLESKMN